MKYIFYAFIFLFPFLFLLSGCQTSQGICSNIEDERLLAACNQLEEQCPPTNPECAKYWKNFNEISKGIETAAAQSSVMENAERGDWSGCANLTRQVEQSICYQRASKTKEPEDCATIQPPFSYRCYMVLAAEKQDKTLCDNIPETEQERIALDVEPPQMVPLRDLCYQATAAQKQDLSDCDELGTLKYSCYKDIAIMSRDQSVCGKIPADAKRPGYEDFLREGCYSFFATHMAESADCSGMPDDSMKDECYGSLARSAKTLDELKPICLKIQNPGKRNMCYYFGALDQHDMEICRLIADEFATNEAPSQCVCFREFMGRYNFDCSTVAADLQGLCNGFKSSGFCPSSASESKDVYGDCSSDKDCKEMGEGLVCNTDGRCVSYSCTEDNECISKFGANYYYCFQSTCVKHIFTLCSTDNECQEKGPFFSFCNKGKCMCRPDAEGRCNDTWLTLACEDIEEPGFRRMCYQRLISSGSMDCDTVSPDFKDECIASKVGCPPYTYYLPDGTCGCLKDSDCTAKLGPGRWECIQEEERGRGGCLAY